MNHNKPYQAADLACEAFRAEDLAVSSSEISMNRSCGCIPKKEAYVVIALQILIFIAVCIDIGLVVFLYYKLSTVPLTEHVELKVEQPEDIPLNYLDQIREGFIKIYRFLASYFDILNQKKDL